MSGLAWQDWLMIVVFGVLVGLAVVSLFHRGGE